MRRFWPRAGVARIYTLRRFWPHTGVARIYAKCVDSGQNFGKSAKKVRRFWPRTHRQYVDALIAAPSLLLMITLICLVLIV